MKKYFLYLGIIALIAVSFFVGKYTNFEADTTPIRTISYDFKNQEITLSEIVNDKEVFNKQVPVGYSNPSLYGDDFNFDNRYVVSTVLEDMPKVPKIYVFDFQEKSEVPVDETIYKDVEKEFESNGSISYRYYWHPSKNVLVVILQGLYYPSKLYIFKIANNGAKLEYVDEAKFENALDLMPYEWVRDESYRTDYFLVEVITNKENVPGTGAFTITGKYFALVNSDGEIEY